MKFILLLFYLVTVPLLASKPYLVMVSQEGCVVCEETFQMFNKSLPIQNALKEYTDFNVVTKEEALSVGLNIRVTPTFFFFGREKRALLVAPIEGKPENEQEFIEYIKEVYEKHSKIKEE